MVMALVMSRKGIDFESGGGFIEDRSGKRIFYEQECEYGDWLIYGKTIVHGVEDVDPGEPFALDSAAGRIVGLMTLHPISY